MIGKYGEAASLSSKILGLSNTSTGGGEETKGEWEDWIFAFAQKGLLVVSFSFVFVCFAFSCLSYFVFVFFSMSFRLDVDTLFAILSFCPKSSCALIDPPFFTDYSSLDSELASFLAREPVLFLNYFPNPIPLFAN